VAVLVVTFLGMALCEAAENQLLTLPRSVAAPLAIAVNALQLVIVLAATWTVLRAWRQKSAHEEALARLVEKVIFAQEEERRRIAFELHDGVSPLVVSAKQHAEVCRDVLDSDRARADAELGHVSERLREAVEEMRHVLRALRPSSVDADGLALAVRRSLDDAARDTGWTAHLDDGLGDARLPAAVETAAFRIVQEAISNAARHAKTERLEVELRLEPAWLCVRVRDHGAGFTVPPPSASGIGLASMQERARLLGGTCDLDSRPGDGTTVRVRLPRWVGAPS
jgi:two-component system sensor histidine kinase NreB